MRAGHGLRSELPAHRPTSARSSVSRQSNSIRVVDHGVNRLVVAVPVVRRGLGETLGQRLCAPIEPDLSVVAPGRVARRASDANAGVEVEHGQAGVEAAGVVERNVNGRLTAGVQDLPAFIGRDKVALDATATRKRVVEHRAHATIDRVIQVDRGRWPLPEARAADREYEARPRQERRSESVSSTALMPRDASSENRTSTLALAMFNAVNHTSRSSRSRRGRPKSSPARNSFVRRLNALMASSRSSSRR